MPFGLFDRLNLAGCFGMLTGVGDTPLKYSSHAPSQRGVCCCWTQGGALSIKSMIQILNLNGKRPKTPIGGRRPQAGPSPLSYDQFTVQSRGSVQRPTSSQ